MVRSAFPPRMVAAPEHRTEMRALPGLLQTMALLPLAHDALEATIEQAVAENPALERSPARPCDGCGYPCSRSRCARCSARSPLRLSADRVDRTEPVEHPFETLEVLAGLEVDSRARGALVLVIDHLTDRGLLDTDPTGIAATHAIPLAHVQEAIRAIVAVGPPGIATRSVAELLTEQARTLVTAGAAPSWLIRLVRDHLPLVADRDAAAIGAALSVPVDAVEPVLSLIRRRLRPTVDVQRRPRSEPTRPPDIFVYRDGGPLTVAVPDSDALGLTLVEADPLLRAHPEARDWLQGHERAARQLLAQVDARAGTVRRVATEVIRCEQGYFERGPAGQVDLTRTEVAGAVGVHPSTVSRAVAGKVLRCPDGRLIELGDLFGTGTAIRARLLELTATPGAAGLSDAQLASRLAAEGFPIARRTVAKYRAQLGLPARFPAGS